MCSSDLFHSSLPGALGLVGQCSQGNPLVVQEGNRTALHFEGGEFGLIHLLEEPLDALGRVAARLLDDLGINGVHRVVIDKNAPALPISLPIRQAPGLGLRLGLRLWLWLGLWLGLRLRLGILPREGIVPAAATSAQSQQGEEEHRQKSADTKLSAFHDTHSI